MEMTGLPHLDLGTIRLRWLNGGAFRMDGAAVFGQVPRPVWSAILPPDEDNRVGLAAHVVLVETGDEFGLIETGVGQASTRREGASLFVEYESSLEADLAALGIARQDIRWVILTHLHPDHAGGMTIVGEDGLRAALFPNARYVVQRREVETFQDAGNRWHHMLDADGLGILRSAGLLEQVDGEANVAPGIRVFLTGGHTLGHQGVSIAGSDTSALCLGDLLPTRHHVDPVCVPAVDDFPLDSIATKRVEVAHAAELGAWLVIAHDRDVLALRRRADGTLASELRSSGRPAAQQDDQARQS